MSSFVSRWFRMPCRRTKTWWCARRGPPDVQPEWSGFFSTLNWRANVETRSKITRGFSLFGRIWLIKPYILWLHHIVIGFTWVYIPTSGEDTMVIATSKSSKNFERFSLGVPGIQGLERPWRSWSRQWRFLPAGCLVGPCMTHFLGLCIQSRYSSVNRGEVRQSRIFKDFILLDWQTAAQELARRILCTTKSVGRWEEVDQDISGLLIHVWCWMLLYLLKLSWIASPLTCAEASVYTYTWCRKPRSCCPLVVTFTETVTFTEGHFSIFGHSGL